MKLTFKELCAVDTALDYFGDYLREWGTDNYSEDEIPELRTDVAKARQAVRLAMEAYKNGR